MKEVLISIQPCWCEKIAARWKTMELRKSKPNIPVPFKCYIYQTKHKWVFKLLRTLSMNALADTLGGGFGKVIGEFVCDHILGHCEMSNADLAEQQSYMRREDISEYSGGKEVYGWHISDLKIYDRPKELWDFHNSSVCWLKGCDIPYLYDPPCEACGKSRLTRPPQSWCYVDMEEKEE